MPKTKAELEAFIDELLQGSDLDSEARAAMLEDLLGLTKSSQVTTATHPEPYRTQREKTRATVAQMMGARSWDNPKGVMPAPFLAALQTTPDQIEAGVKAYEECKDRGGPEALVKAVYQAMISTRYFQDAADTLTPQAARLTNIQREIKELKKQIADLAKK